MFVAVDGALSGLIAVTDPIKDTTPEAIAQLHAEGVRVVMMTGDSRTTAEAVARTLGIDDVMPGVLPDQKAAAVKSLQDQGRIVAMAGDGINDAPALAQAHVGIAMGTGTDVAIESAGVTLVKGDLRGIVRARRLSSATMANIKQNLLFAFVYNALGVPIAAGVLYPWFGILLDELQLRVGDRECAASAKSTPLTRSSRSDRRPRRLIRVLRELRPLRIFVFIASSRATREITDDSRAGRLPRARRRRKSDAPA
jgi:magnesium-transporting ATPase (P-type)